MIVSNKYEKNEIVLFYFNRENINLLIFFLQHKFRDQSFSARRFCVSVESVVFISGFEVKCSVVRCRMFIRDHPFLFNFVLRSWSLFFCIPFKNRSGHFDDISKTEQTERIDLKESAQKTTVAKNRFFFSPPHPPPQSVFFILLRFCSHFS